METVDWALAIEKNRDALLRIVVALLAMAGLADADQPPATLPRHLRNAVLRILRPAESAVRRLIIIAARGVEVRLLLASPLRGGGRVASEARQSRVGVRTTDRGDLLPPPGSAAPSAMRPVCFSDLPSRGRLGARKPASEEPHCDELKGGTKTPFPLIDPLKRFHFGPVRRKSEAFPRITCIGLSDPTPIPDDWIPSPDDEVDAKGIFGRLTALQSALDNLDGQARRLARWKARRDHGLNRSKRFSPMRPGWPPGRRKRRTHEIDDILTDLHSLAVHARELDTS